MKIKIICVTFFMATLLLACNKKNEQITEADLSLVDILKVNNVKTDGSVVLTATHYSFSQVPVAQIDISAHFRDAQGLAKCETVTVGGVELTEEGGIYKKHFGVFTTPTEMPRITTDLFGKQLDVTVKSAQYGDVKASLYAPTPLQMELPNDKTHLLNTGEGLTIRWKPDAGQMQRNIGQVGVLVQYHAGFSVNQDKATLPRENVSVYKAANDADGAVHFSTQELNKLPKGGTVVVYSARAQQNISTNANHRTTAVTVLSHSSSSELLVQ